MKCGYKECVLPFFISVCARKAHMGRKIAKTQSLAAIGAPLRRQPAARKKSAGGSRRKSRAESRAHLRGKAEKADNVRKM